MGNSTSAKIYTSRWPDFELFDGNIVEFVKTGAYSSNQTFRSKKILIDPFDKTSLTLEQVFNITERLAWILHNKYGVKYDQVVLLFSTTHLYTIPIHYSLLSAGAIISPANVMYTPKELALQISESKSEFIITRKSLLETVKEANALENNRISFDKIITIEQLLDDLTTTPIKHTLSPVKLDKAQSAEKLAYLCFSSGTSGKPKGVMTTHLNITSNTMRHMLSGPDLWLEDAVLRCSLPLTHIYGLNAFCFGSVFCGCQVILFEKFHFENFLKYSAEYKATTALLVPPIIIGLAKHPIVDKYPEFQKHLKVIIGSAAPLSEEVAIQVKARLGGKVKIIQGYGMTEASPMVCNNGLLKDDMKTVGQLAPMMKARLVNEDGKDVAEGDAGVLLIKGPNIMKGYLNNQKETDATMIDGWYNTGDVAIVKGDDWYIVDRVKELIKSKGHQVAPAELEGILLTNPAVIDCAVIGIHKIHLGTELPRAFVVLKKGTDPLSIKIWFDEKVAKYKRLWGGIVVLEAIPKSASGKILRRELKALKGYEVFGQLTPESKL